MTEAEFAAKTTDCATFAAKPLPADTADRLISTVGKLESLPGYLRARARHDRRLNRPESSQESR